MRFLDVFSLKNFQKFLALSFFMWVFFNFFVESKKTTSTLPQGCDGVHELVMGKLDDAMTLFVGDVSQLAYTCVLALMTTFPQFNNAVVRYENYTALISAIQPQVSLEPTLRRRASSYTPWNSIATNEQAFQVMRDHFTWQTFLWIQAFAKKFSMGDHAIYLALKDAVSERRDNAMGKGNINTLMRSKKASLLNFVAEAGVSYASTIPFAQQIGMGGIFSGVMSHMFAHLIKLYESNHNEDSGDDANCADYFNNLVEVAFQLLRKRMENCKECIGMNNTELAKKQLNTGWVWLYQRVKRNEFFAVVSKVSTPTIIIAENALLKNMLEESSGTFSQLPDKAVLLMNPLVMKTMSSAL